MTAERASAIVNDIHEGMCRASRVELMACASLYAIENCRLYSEALDAHTRILTAALEQYMKFKAEQNQPKETRP